MESGERFDCLVKPGMRVHTSVSLADVLRTGTYARRPTRITRLPARGIAMVEDAEGGRRPADLVLDAFIRRLRVGVEGKRQVVYPTVSVTAWPNVARTTQLWKQLEDGWYSSPDGRYAEMRKSPHRVLQEMFQNVLGQEGVTLVLGGRIQVVYYWARVHGQWKPMTAVRSGMRIGFDAEPRRLLRRLEFEHKQERRRAIKRLEVLRFLELLWNPPKIPKALSREDDHWTDGHPAHSILLGEIDRNLVPGVLAPIWSLYYMGNKRFAHQLRDQGIELPNPILNAQARNEGIRVHLPVGAIQTAHFEGLDQSTVTIEDDEDNEYE